MKNQLSSGSFGSTHLWDRTRRRADTDSSQRYLLACPQSSSSRQTVPDSIYLVSTTKRVNWLAVSHSWQPGDETGEHEKVTKTFDCITSMFHIKYKEFTTRYAARTYLARILSVSLQVARSSRVSSAQLPEDSDRLWAGRWMLTSLCLTFFVLLFKLGGWKIDSVQIEFCDNPRKRTKRWQKLIKSLLTKRLFHPHRARTSSNINLVSAKPFRLDLEQFVCLGVLGRVIFGNFHLNAIPRSTLLHH